MPAWLTPILTSVGTLIITLTVTFVFNKVVSLPKALKKAREEEQKYQEQLEVANKARDLKISALEAAVNALPSYRAQSLNIQAQLQNTDKEILGVCERIEKSVDETKDTINKRLDHLEKREKNAIRAKLLEEYRLFTDMVKNPMQAWTEMEHHAFFEVVKDYEELGGNDYVHSEVIPTVNKLAVIPMADLTRLSELMKSRKL